MKHRTKILSLLTLAALGSLLAYWLSVRMDPAKINALMQANSQKNMEACFDAAGWMPVSGRVKTYEKTPAQEPRISQRVRLWKSETTKRWMVESSDVKFLRDSFLRADCIEPVQDIDGKLLFVIKERASVGIELFLPPYS